MKRFLLALIFALLAWGMPVMAQDSYDSFSEPDGGAWNTTQTIQEYSEMANYASQGLVGIMTYPFRDQIKSHVRDSVSKGLAVTPGGLLIKPAFDMATKGEIEQDDVHKLYWYILVAILAIYVLADDFIWLFKNWVKAGAWKLIKKIFVIVATFVSIPIPVWDVVFLVIRAIIKIVKVIRTTRRVVNTVKAVSKAGENPQAAAMAARQAAASYSAKRANDARQQTQRQAGQESGRPQTGEAGQNQAQGNTTSPGQVAPVPTEQAGGRNSTQVAYVNKQLDEVERLWQGPKENQRRAQAQNEQAPEATPVQNPQQANSQAAQNSANTAGIGPASMKDADALTPDQKKPTRQGRKADIRGKRAAPNAGMRSRTRVRA